MDLGISSFCLSYERDHCQALFPPFVMEHLSREKHLWFCSGWSTMTSGSKEEQWYDKRLRETELGCTVLINLRRIPEKEVDGT